jgi:hypothetical protein
VLARSSFDRRCDAASRVPLVVVADADPSRRSGWRSLCCRTPLSDVRCRLPGTVEWLHTFRRLACGTGPLACANGGCRALTREIRTGQTSPGLEASAASDPERLPSCPDPRGFPPRVDAPSQGCPREKRSFVHPFAGSAPRRLVKGRLGSNLASVSIARPCDRTASTQRCFGPISATHISKTSTRVTCGDRLASRGEPPLADGFRVSRRSTRFGQLARRWHRAFSSRHGPTRAGPPMSRHHPIRYSASRRCSEPDDQARFHRPP